MAKCPWWLAWTNSPETYFFVLLQVKPPLSRLRLHSTRMDGTLPRARPPDLHMSLHFSSKSLSWFIKFPGKYPLIMMFPEQGSIKSPPLP